MAHIADTPLVSRQIHLHSSHADVRKDNKSSDCLWYLHNPIRVPPNIEILIGIENVQIPHSIYTITEGNNQVEWIIVQNVPTIPGHVDSYYIIETIEPGVYSIEDFINEKVKSSSHKVGYGIVEGNNNYHGPAENLPDPFDKSKYRFDDSAADPTNYYFGKLYFTIGVKRSQHKLLLKTTLPMAHHTMIFSKDFNPLGLKMHQRVTHNVSTAPNCYDLNGLSSILLGSNFATANIDSAHTGVNNSILARIPVTAAPGGTIFYERKSDFQIVLKEDQFSQIHLRLMDDHRNPIDLNGLDWHITLNFNFRYSPGMQRPSNLQDIHNTNAVYRLKNLNEDTIDTAADPLLGNFFKMTKEELEQQNEGIKNIDK